jgi:hypothetical protein
MNIQTAGKTVKENLMNAHKFVVLVAVTITVLIMSCSDPNGGGGQDALTMSDYLKYVQPKSEEWGDRSVTVYHLNPEYKEEIITFFSNENRLVIDTYSRDWELGKTVFRYVELVELKNGTNFCPKFLQYSASDSTILTEYMAFNEPKIGDTIVMPWDEGDMTIEYLGQNSPSSIVFNESPPFGRWMYPGYYKLTCDGYSGHRYLHISGGSDGTESVAKFTSWDQP